MSKWIVFLALSVLGIHSFGQGSWSKLGPHEKIWVVLHPFSVKKAKNISEQVLVEIDSLNKSGYFKSNTLSGSKSDALKHAYWMAQLSYKIGPKRALWLGKAHEKKNKRDFKKRELEDSKLPDLVAIQMDLANNRVGVDLGAGCIVCSDLQILNVCKELLKNGDLVYIKQNEAGQFLNNADEVIEKEEWQGKWRNERMLWPTDL